MIAILAALRARDRDGNGAVLDIALADVLMPLQFMPLAALGATGAAPQRGEGYLDGGAAAYGVYATRDGRHVVLAANDGKFWQAFCIAAERPAWIERAREPLPQRALIADVAAYLSELTLQQCLERFASPECCLTPVFRLEEAVASERIASRGVVRHAHNGALQALMPVVVDGDGPELRRALQASRS